MRARTVAQVPIHVYRRVVSPALLNGKLTGRKLLVLALPNTQPYADQEDAEKPIPWPAGGRKPGRRSATGRVRSIRASFSPRSQASR